MPLARYADSIGPGNLLLACRMWTPDVKPIMAHSHHRTATPGVGCEPRVAEKPAGNTGDLVLAYCQMDETVGWVAEGPLKEIVIAREKCGPR
jgi:hypothetical protein